MQVLPSGGSLRTRPALRPQVKQPLPTSAASAASSARLRALTPPGPVQLRPMCLQFCREDTTGRSSRRFCARRRQPSPAAVRNSRCGPPTGCTPHCTAALVGPLDSSGSAPYPFHRAQYHQMELMPAPYGPIQLYSDVKSSLSQGGSKQGMRTRMLVRKGGSATQPT